MVGLMVTSKRVHTKGAPPRTSAASVPISTVSHCRSRLSQETLQHQQVGLVQSRSLPLGPDVCKILFVPSESLFLPVL